GFEFTQCDPELPGKFGAGPVHAEALRRLRIELVSEIALDVAHRAVKRGDGNIVSLGGQEQRTVMADGDVGEDLCRGQACKNVIALREGWGRCSFRSEHDAALEQAKEALTPVPQHLAFFGRLAASAAACEKRDLVVFLKP